MFSPPSAHALTAADCALAHLEPFDAGDQLAATGWATVAVFGALRARFEKATADQATFDLLCSKTQAWLRREIAALRFTEAD